MRIAPRIPHGVDWVNATFDGPRGMISSSWRVTAVADTRAACVAAGVRPGSPSNVELHVTAPRDSVLRVVLPLTGKVVKVDSGKLAVLTDAVC